MFLLHTFYIHPLPHLTTASSLDPTSAIKLHKNSHRKHISCPRDSLGWYTAMSLTTCQSAIFLPVEDSPAGNLSPLPSSPDSGTLLSLTLSDLDHS